MAKTQYLFACIVFLLAFVICHEPLLTEGRHLKSKNNQQSGEKKSSQTINLHKNAAAVAGHKYLSALSMDPTQNPEASDKNMVPQCHSPGVGHPFAQSADESKQSAAAKSKSDNNSPKLDDKPYDYSPGVGHAFVDHYDKDATKPVEELKKKNKYGGSERKHFIETDKLLAHSPGVGHAVTHSQDDGVKPRP